MDLKLHSPVLIVKDLDGMRDFYQRVLGQPVEFDFGQCVVFQCGLSIWKLEKQYPLAQKLGRVYSKHGNQNLELCFESDHFSEVLSALKKQAIDFLHEEEEEPWGQKTVRFYDPEHNLIEVGETIACFVKRFSAQGMTAEEVHRRTSVPLAHVEDIIRS